MISFEKAQQIVLDHTKVLEPVKVPVMESVGMVLADDVISGFDIPSADMAKIGGFAIKSMDAINSGQRNPASLIIDGDIKAGDKWNYVVKSGHAIRVEAGAPLPEGADTIIPTDNIVRENAKKVNIYKREKPGEYISMKGGEIEEGEIVFSKGRVLNPSDMGALAALGMTEVLCYRKPKVSFFVSGNDLIAPDQSDDMGKTRSANTFAIQAHLQEFGAIPDNLGIIDVDQDSIMSQVEKAAKSDMLIVSTGPSLNVFEKVKAVLQKIGMDLKFWKVAIRPGKPLTFSTYNDIPVFGISENQISTAVVLEEFVRPAILKMCGRREVRRTEVVARLDREIKGGGGKTHFVGAEIKLVDDGFIAIPENNMPSKAIRAFTTANGLIVIPPSVNNIEAGEMVRVQIIGNPTDIC